MIAYEPDAEDEQVTGRQSLLSRGARFQLRPVLRRSTVRQLVTFLACRKDITKPILMKLQK